MAKDLPAIQETQVLSVGREDPLGKGIDTYFSILPGVALWATIHRVAKSGTHLSD